MDNSTANKIRRRAQASADTAARLRVEAQKILQAEIKRSHKTANEGGFPVYYIQNLASLITRTAKDTSDLASVTLTTLDGWSGDKKVLNAASILGKSTTYQGITTSQLYASLVAALAARTSA